ncbi:hypothetical protein [Candidatus Poriferisodalis sp.]|uniref:hypothetical protein n=1 Tax=Candidatus Poriferisodalis sp. TaxID=3101277 RepID=UPI003B01B12D
MELLNLKWGGGGVRRAVVVVAALLPALAALPTAVSAQSAGAYVSGAEQWTESDCAGDVPIVVASDSLAQSDVYSAVALAGALDTECVILAGPRDGTMPARQRLRLSAAGEGGYVLGTTGAVSASKVLGRNLTRVGGINRWATAHLVGVEARAQAGGGGTPRVPRTALSLPSDVEQPGVVLGGAEAWVASDCTNDVPVIVGSDANAQSDIYSAVTLAGALGTDCVVLAGPRDGDMPASQSERLESADQGGFVVGGTAAVPEAKVAGRDAERVQGSDRWATAHLVGRTAAGKDIDTDSGSDPVGGESGDDPVGKDPADAFRRGDPGDDSVLRDPGAVSPRSDPTITALSIGSWHMCALRSDNSVRCKAAGHYGWIFGSSEVLGNKFGQARSPEGMYTAVSAGGWHTCGLRSNSVLKCWGRNDAPSRQTSHPRPCVEYNDDGSCHRYGEYEWTAMDTGLWYTCGIRANKRVYCWGSFPSGHRAQEKTPSGDFTKVSAGGSHSCGLRTNKKVACWGFDSDGQTNAPNHDFTAVSAGYRHSCGLRTNKKVVCWGDNDYGQTSAPNHDFTAVSAGHFHSCGVRTNKQVVCWGRNLRGQTDVPSGSNFTAVSAGIIHSCGVRSDGTATCWGTLPRNWCSPSPALTSSALGIEAFKGQCSTTL